MGTICSQYMAEVTGVNSMGWLDVRVQLGFGLTMNTCVEIARTGDYHNESCAIVPTPATIAVLLEVLLARLVGVSVLLQQAVGHSHLFEVYEIDQALDVGNDLVNQGYAS